MPETIEKIVWSRDQYNQNLLRMKAMGLSQESIDYIMQEVVIDNKTEESPKQQITWD